MGNCLATEAHVPTAITASPDRLPSSAAGSQSTGYTTASGGSNTNSSNCSFYTANNQFSAGDGYDETYPTGLVLPSGSLKIFSFAELKVATRNFRSDTVLGEGAFGKVFQGWIGDKGPGKIGRIEKVMAVKKLNSQSPLGFKEWQSQVNFLGRLSHPNLVRLLGYCWEDCEQHLLVYEFMQKGSLERHLFGGFSALEPLLWDKRLKIAIGAARGLAFLHTTEKQVIYGVFTTSNILLDWSYTAKISDFGLARFGPSTCQSYVTTRVVGTLGYAAPESVATGRLYVKSDVYGFGVVLVEILTGLRAVDTKRPSGKHNLVDWIKPYLSDRRKLRSIMDYHLEGRYPSEAAFQVARLARNCLEAKPMNRPSMKEVVERLERIKATSERTKQPKFKIPFFASSPSKTKLKLINNLP